MDESILSGPNMSVVGIATVFVALLLMIFAINVMQRFLHGDAGADSRVRDAGTARKVEDTADAASKADEDTLRRAALAAYAFHISNNVRVPVATGSSPWQRAGRAAQVTGRRPRN